MNSPPMFWDGVVRRLGAEVPAFVVDAWVRPLVAEAGDGEDSVRLSCPSALHLERVRDRYLPRLVALASEEVGRPIAIALGMARAPAAPEPAETEPPRPRNDVEASSPEPPRPATASKVGAMARRKVASKAPRRPSAGPQQVELTFENFVVGPCNRLAREASLAVALDKQQPVNPLYLTSAPGLGKTHLARAIAVARSRGDGRVIYTSAENFTNRFTDAIRNKKMDQFKNRFRRQCDVLVVEDVQFLSSKKGTQLELFHTVSHLLDVGARVVMTADRLPREIASLDERLGSRMTAGLVAGLEQPDALVRREILRVKAAGGGIHLPDDCLDLLVDVVRGSVRDLEGALVQLVTSASLLKRPIDRDLAEQALRKIASTLPPAKQLEPAVIIDAVAKFFGTTPATLASRTRRRDVNTPRQLAMYLCRRYTKLPASAIARAFGRNHPSVANAEKAVERQILESAPFRYRVEAIASRLDELERDRNH